MNREQIKKDFECEVHNFIRPATKDSLAYLNSEYLWKWIQKALDQPQEEIEEMDWCNLEGTPTRALLIIAIERLNEHSRRLNELALDK